jgi:hypothetical protein
MALSLSGDGTITGRTPESGEVLQIVNVLDTGEYVQSGVTYVPVQIANLTKTFTTKGANSKFKIDVRWMGEIESGEFYNSVFNLEVNGTIINRKGTEMWEGLMCAGSTYTYTDTASTPDMTSFSTLYESSIPAGTSVTVKLLINFTDTNYNKTVWTGRCAGGASAGKESASSEIIITEVAA